MTKAVIVGINNYLQAPLQGCVNDAQDVIAHLTRAGVPAREIHPLFDERATKAAIIDALHAMVATSRAGDHLLFHYSGHGTQVAALGPEEPDGLDECLCPVDFDWDDTATQLRDDDLAAVFATVPRGVAITVVIDACHSGDMLRLMARRPGRARYLAWPADVAFRMAHRARRAKPLRLAASRDTLLVAACRSSELAADAEFDGRANGAFTYHFLRALRANARTPLSELIVALGRPLAEFEMHPELDGLVAMQRAPFFLALARREASDGEPTKAHLLFDQSWLAKVFGMPFAIGASVLSSDAALELQIACDAGVPSRWSCALLGDARREIELGAGFQIHVEVRRWQEAPTAITFELALALAPPFLSPIVVAQQNVALPRAIPTAAVASPTSPADLLAMIQRAQQAKDEPPAPRARPLAPRDGDAQFTGMAGQHSFAGGLFGCRYNKHMEAHVPPGFLRDHVEVVLDPPDSGNVYFVQWDDSDPHIGQFTYHVGCAAFGGGTATFNLHCVRDPAVREIRPAQPGISVSATQSVGRGAHVLNGHSRVHEAGATPR